MPNEHLLADPGLQKLGSNAEMKPFDELVSLAIFQRIQHGGNYRYTGEKGEWVCPYCLLKTDILIKNWDGSDAELKFCVPQILQHFGTCAEYQQDPVNGAKTVEEIKEAGGDKAKLKRYLKDDPRFKLCDPTGAWLDPYSAMPVANLNLKKEPWAPQLHEKLINYMLSPDCPGRYSQFEVERSLEDLQRAAMKRPAVL